MNYFIFIFFGYFLGNVLSQYVLEKYGKTRTTEKSIVFDSSSFSFGEYIYFIFRTERECLRDIDYIFFDDLNDYNPIPSSTFIKHKVKEEKTGNSISSYYTFTKNIGELGSLNGNYLFIKFEDCDTDEVEIQNIKGMGGDLAKSLANKIATIVIAIIAGAIIIVVIIVILVCRARRKKMELINNRNIIMGSYGVSPYGVTPGNANQAIIQQDPNTISSYSYINKNKNMMNNNNMNFSQNTQLAPIGQNYGMPQPVNKSKIKHHSGKGKHKMKK